MTASEDERENTTTGDAHAVSTPEPLDPDVDRNGVANGAGYREDSRQPGVAASSGRTGDSDIDSRASTPATPAKPAKKSSFWKELPILIVIALVLTFLIQTCIARVYVIPSGSMERTLQIGDRILVDKLTYDFSDPKPGDVIVFKGPPGWDRNEFAVEGSNNPVVQWLRQFGSSIGIGSPPEYDLVKRVVAVGGQTVSCCSAQNRVIVDGKSLSEPYVYFQPDRPNYPVVAQSNDPTPNDNKIGLQASFPPVKIPVGDVWVMGDNRNNSADSRYQDGGGSQGVVPLSDVIGKARTVIWPPTRWGGVGDINAQATALGAPGWQEGLPLGVGFAAAWPTWWLSRRVRAGLRAGAGSIPYRRGIRR